MKQPSLAIALSTLFFMTFGIQGETPVVTPAAGLISPEKYTNAFFGFSLPLPQDPALFELALPSKGDYYSLFGLKAQKRGRLTALMVSATQTIGASSELARKAAGGAKEQKTRKTSIDGKEFWESESLEKSAAGKMREIAYVTAIDGYLLQFRILSFDPKLTEELQRCVETLQFFDPTKAAEVAGPNSRAYNPASVPVTPSNEAHN